MKKEKTVADLQVINTQCVSLNETLVKAIRDLEGISKTDATREVAMVKTKLDEATMWLMRYHAGVMVDLANRTCR